MTPAAKFDVIVCGSLHLDIVVRAPTLPRIDETAVGSSWEKLCGGKGGNQAVQAARAGARTAMIGRVGRDEFGDTLRKNLEAEGVDATGVVTDPKTGSGISVAILQDSGDYGAVIVSGANLEIDVATLGRQWELLGGASVLVLQNEIPDSANAAAARLARSAGAQVVLNAAPARQLSDELLGLVDVLVVNRIEAEAMVGRPVIDRPSARAALTAFKGSVPNIVVTLGGDGLVIASQPGEVLEIAPVPVKVVSTHGAGDCFVGVLAAQLARSNSLVDACKLANRQAAAFVSRTHA